METTHAIARRAGILYFVMSILMVLGYMYVPTLFSGTAAETTRKIAEHETLYRVTILISLIAQLLFVFVVVTLYQLFRDVDRMLARVMLCLVCVGVAGEIGTVAGRMAPLLLPRTADYGSAFSTAQLEVLGDSVLVLGNNLARVLTSIWGLWLIPFGILVMKSGFLPKILGILLLAAGLGYMVSCVTYIVFPGSASVISKLVFPLYFGELPIVLWLMVRGAPTTRPSARPATA